MARPRSFTALATGVAVGLLSMVPVLPVPAEAQVTVTPSALQRLRELLGIRRSVAVGGSRGEATLVCVISPWLTGEADGMVTAITPSGAPPIATREPLTEVQIHRGKTLLQRLRAPSAADPLPTPLAWTLPPLAPGESVDLRLRPLNADGGSFAVVRLTRPAAAMTGAPAVEDQPEVAIEQLFQAALEGKATQRQQSGELLQHACRS